jgi:hypothetical protein
MKKDTTTHQKSKDLIFYRVVSKITRSLADILTFPQIIPLTSVTFPTRD